MDITTQWAGIGFHVRLKGYSCNAFFDEPGVPYGAMNDFEGLERQKWYPDELSVECSAPGATNFTGNASSRNRTCV